MTNLGDKKYHWLLYAIIFLEGYVVLSTELVAIRQSIPFVGSGTETISILIAAVLMPLSFGYYMGGRFTDRKHRKRRCFSIRKKLICNVVIAGSILSFATSYLFLSYFLPFLFMYVSTSRVVLISIFSLLFLAYPVFLLGQTVPLISNYFRKSNIANVTGVILCISTVGSFLGSVMSTLVLMSVIGVHNVIIFNTALLCGVVAILNKRMVSLSNGVMLVILLIAIGFNGPWAMKKFKIVEDNAYNTISVVDSKYTDVRRLIINRSTSAKRSDDPSLRYAYINFLEKRFINPIAGNKDRGIAPKSILVVGTGGFTLGEKDLYNHYQFIDIDKSLKRVVEEYYLEAKLPGNKIFHPIPARAFFNQSDEQYDFILLDAYTNVSSTPGHLVTTEFFEQVKQHIKPGGVMAFYVSAAHNFGDRFGVKIDNTLREVFGRVNRHVTYPVNMWQDGNWNVGVVYVYYH